MIGGVRRGGSWVRRLRESSCPSCSGRSEGPKATPLPLAKVVVVSFVLFVNQFGSLMLFPFLPFMVHDFFPHLNREELGQKAGFIGSAFFLGNFIGSFGWGWASDVFGRKRIMLLGLVFTLITELLFGFSQNFAWAVSARFFWGLLNGNLGVAKTYISEICDDSNQAKGFSAIGIGAGIGRLIGSVVGGFLSQPASKYSLFENQFFCQFPYVLPCLVGALICLISFIAAAIFLEETLHKTRSSSTSSVTTNTEGLNSTDSGIELARQLQDDEQEADDTKLLAPGTSVVMMESDIDSESDAGATLSFDEDIASDTELLVATSGERGRGRGREMRERVRRWSASWSPNAIGTRTRDKASRWRASWREYWTACVGCTPRTAWLFLVKKVKLLLLKLVEVARLMVDRKVFLSTSLYGMYGGIHILISETFPLLMVTCYRHGGYHLDGNELGVVIMCSGVIQLIWQFLVYPRMAKLLGYRRTLQFGAVVCVLCFILIPLSSHITGPIGGAADNLCDTNSNSSSSDSLFSGSGSGAGSSLQTNSSQFCEVNYALSVNEDSVIRIPIRVWAMLLGIMTLLVIGRMSGFVSIFILVGNSTLPETRGSVNGISQSLVAISRSIFPLVGSLLFAWSESNEYGWPLDYHFVFNMVIILTLILLLMTFFLPKSIEKKRERPTLPPQPNS